MAPIWISFSGLDGAGKSTQIQRLDDHLRSLDLRVQRLTMHDDVSLAAMLRRTRRHAPQSPTTPAANPPAQPKSASAAPTKGVAPRLDKNRSDGFTLRARQITYLADLASLTLLRRRRHVRQADVVIIDRYLFDSLANLLAVRPASTFYIRRFLSVMPHPEVALLLDLDAEVAFQRKPEYPLDYMHQRRRAYRDLFGRVPTGCTIHADQHADHVHQQVLDAVRRRLGALSRGAIVPALTEGLSCR